MPTCWLPERVLVAGFVFSIALFYITEAVKRSRDKKKIIAGLKREVAFNRGLCNAWLKSIGDIRLPYPVQPSNATRLLALMEHATVSIIIDHLGVAQAWSDAMRRVDRVLDVLVKVDVGFHRCGIDPGAEGALNFIQAANRMSGLRLRHGRGWRPTASISH